MPRRYIETGIPRQDITPERSDWLQRTYWNSLAYTDDYIGTISTPRQIAMVEAGGVRTTIDLDSWLIRFSGTGEWTSLDRIAGESAEGIKAKALIDLWTRLRWEKSQRYKRHTAANSASPQLVRD